MGRQAGTKGPREGIEGIKKKSVIIIFKGQGGWYGSRSGDDDAIGHLVSKLIKRS